MTEPAIKVDDPDPFNDTKAAPAPDHVAIRSHVELVHTLAKAAKVDGVLILGRADVKTRSMKIERFAVGNVEGMIDAIIGWSTHPNLNLYMPYTIFRKDLPQGAKGGEDDARAVLAFVGDLDSDEGKTSVGLDGLPLPPLYVVETSEDNFQPVYPLDRAAAPEGAKSVSSRLDVKAVAVALGNAIGGDGGTKDISHLWRIPGTLNWPTKNKLDRGRSPIPRLVTIKSPWTGETMALETLWQEVKGFAKAPVSSGSSSSKGTTTETFDELPAFLKKLIASQPYKGEQRGRTSASVIYSLFRRGWSDDAVQSLFQAHPNGVGERYAQGKTSLRKDVERLRQKFDESNAAEAEPEKEKVDPPPPKKLAEVHAAFTKWLGEEYDLDAANFTLAAGASERLPGDPLWGMVVGGPSGAKTETVQSLMGSGAHVTSTISSEGALLSATPQKQRSKKATGGLLRKMGTSGVLVIKDFTSILSAAREIRGMVLAALREIYDGRWERNVGTDGGQTLTWNGRIVVIAAVTTAWDAMHSVVALMGDRFVLLRLGTEDGRKASAKKAISNSGQEKQMRQELAEAVGGLIANIDTKPYELADDEEDKIVATADLVTMARSAVEHDFKGDIQFAHALEAPMRFAKQLVQLLRGAIAIGMEKNDAMRLVRRCAYDSIPPIRRDILLDLMENPAALASEIRKRISQPNTTTRRGLQELHVLKVLTCVETTQTTNSGKTYIEYRYSLKAEYDAETLKSVVPERPQTGTPPGQVSPNDVDHGPDEAEEAPVEEAETVVVKRGLDDDECPF